MTVEFTLLSAFAPPSTHLSDEVCKCLNELEESKKNDANRLVHMRTGRRQLETFLQKQHKGATTFEQELARDSLQWKDHVDKARQNEDVMVQNRCVLPEILPGLKLYDIKVGRRGRPDDAVYLKSSYARQWLPRGNCIAEWQTQDTTYFFPVVRGYRKFTGQEDDGELKKQTESEEEKLSKFFTTPQTRSKWFIRTSKENGEAGHLAVLKRSDGKFVYILGSKNTHLLAQTLEDIERVNENQKQADKKNAFFAAAPIAAAILRKLLALDPAKHSLLCEFLWQTRATASFEVLCTRHQHVQHLGSQKEDKAVFYGLSLMSLDYLEGADICVNPVLLYELMNALGVPIVDYEVFKFNTDALEAARKRSKCAYQHEGDVVLFLDKDVAVIGMQKHKSVWYVCVRAIREKAKTFCRTLNSIKPPADPMTSKGEAEPKGETEPTTSKNEAEPMTPKAKAKPMTPTKALHSAKNSMQKRFQAIPGYMRISDEIAHKFEALGEQFIEYLFEKKLFRGVAANNDEKEKCKKVARDLTDKFPVVWKKFLEKSGLDDAISSTPEITLVIPRAKA